MTNYTRKWFAIYTKQGTEKKVANSLMRKNIESYCPMVRRGTARKKVSLEPLFPSFVFIHINEADAHFVKRIDGVVNFVYWLNKPAVIKEEEVGILRRFLSEYSNVTLEKMPFVQGAALRVPENDPFFNGAPLIAVENNKVKIGLPSLGYRIVAETEDSGVEVMSTFNEAFAANEQYTLVV